MSHFVTILRLDPSELPDDPTTKDVEDYCSDLLHPYHENLTDGEFCEFEDNEQEYREAYETETCEMVQLEDGRRVSPHDEMFRPPPSNLIEELFRSTPQAPDHLPRVEVPFRERYATFEEYAREWHGSRPDEKTGRYGYWRNTQAKWDWWVIGGRWTGYFPVKNGAKLWLGERGAFESPPRPGHADIVRYADIDQAEVLAQQNTSVQKFLDLYDQYLAGEHWDAFDGPRSKALDIGLVRVEKQLPSQLAPNEIALPWSAFVKPGDDRAGWYDIARRVHPDEFRQRYANEFHPLTPYAVLDHDGWHAPGTMGWWGMSSDKPNDLLKFDDWFVTDWLPREVDPRTLLVAADLHI